jgi:hypothetical protein
LSHKEYTLVGEKEPMRVWLVWILAVVWAGFWLWYGVGWAIHERLAWQGVALNALRPGLVFVAIVLIAWFWPRLGGVLLILTGFVLAAWYAIYFGHMPTSTKLFALSTIALPPLVCGLILLWPSTGRTGTAA